MNTKYLNELLGYLERTVVTIDADEHEYLYDSDEMIRLLINEFVECKARNNTAIFIGNGGSAAIASHMTADYMKNGGIKTYSLYDNAVITCMGNDYGYEYLFSKPLEFLSQKNDLLIAISSSGESKNIINAIDIAKSNKSRVITLTGFGNENSVRRRGDLNIWVPCDKYGIVESIHNLILQHIVDILTGLDVL